MPGPNRSATQVRRASKAKVVKEKFQHEREERINESPLKPMNHLQKEYIRLIREKSIIIASGYPGTSKTYIPTVMACDAYRSGQIEHIYITRPAVSNSKSLGFWSGDLVSKMQNWLGPVLAVMTERLGQGALEVAIKRGDIVFVPFEVIKGHSFKNCYVLLDEAEDITVEEAKKFVTRLGENCTAVLAGDIGQSELGAKSGLRRLIELAEANPELEETTGWVDFNRPEDIVRSRVCKDWTMAFYREENQ